MIDLNLLIKRDYYKPFVYPKAYEFWDMQDSVHWRRTEINLNEDLSDFKFKMNKNDRDLIGGILKGFTQAEVLVGDYWRHVARLFPHPEIAMMASCFSHFEGIHQDNYSLLNTTLGLEDFQAFMQDETTKNKLDFLVGKIENIHFSEAELYILKNSPLNVPTSLQQKLVDLATSIAIFSAFTEGTIIFSSFIILFAYSRSPYDMLKGTSKIVEFSIRDENIHSSAGCWLFNELCKEFPWLKEMAKESILKAALQVNHLEGKFVQNLFSSNEISPISLQQLENFIQVRINLKLKELGYEEIFESNKELTQQTDWFYQLTSGRRHTDFFAATVSEYTKKDITKDELW